jgi:hypothetical protein
LPTHIHGEPPQSVDKICISVCLSHGRCFSSSKYSVIIGYLKFKDLQATAQTKSKCSTSTAIPQQIPSCNFHVTRSAHILTVNIPTNKMERMTISVRYMFRQWGANFREFDRSKQYTSNTPFQVYITCIGLTAILKFWISMLYNITAW